MEIDIINYTDEQYAVLSEEQLLEVKSAQTKKNTLLKKLEEDKQAFRCKLIENGTFLSSTYQLQCEKLTADCEEQITAIRDALLFYLRFSVRSSGVSPYPIDYSLPLDQRFYDVRDYYMETYSDPSERHTALKKDEIAKMYLGEYYIVLVDFFGALANENT
jgi:hypothetical protein